MERSLVHLFVSSSAWNSSPPASGLWSVESVAPTCLLVLALLLGKCLFRSVHHQLRCFIRSRTCFGCTFPRDRTLHNFDPNHHQTSLDLCSTFHLCHRANCCHHLSRCLPHHAGRTLRARVCVRVRLHVVTVDSRTTWSTQVTGPAVLDASHNHLVK